MDDKYYMALAIQLAKATLGQTSPNPVVGAIIVKHNQILGLGTHLQAGMAHAEILALDMAGSSAKGATLYVTLEPCTHFGRTPPCTLAIIQAEISRVVIACTDLNPLVAGQGIQQLQAAGIEVTFGIMEEEAKELNQVFFHYIQTKTPYITLKAGMSLDAKLATSSGESKWITNAAARADAHIYRHTHDAILVGINSILADDPSLTTRLVNGGKQPIRIILDTQLRTPLTSRVITNQPSQTWIITGNQVSAYKQAQYGQLGVKLLAMDTSRIEIRQLLPILGQQGITSILVEGGNQVHSNFLQAGLFNQLVLYLSPSLIGGNTAPNFFAGTGFAQLRDALSLKFKRIETIAENLKIVAVPLAIQQSEIEIK